LSRARYTAESRSITAVRFPVIVSPMSDAVTPISEPGLKGDVTTVELDRLERTVARRSAEARATIPTTEFSDVVDVDRLLERDAELGCGVTAIVVAAAANALRAVPRVNGSYRDGRYELYSRVNVGVTIVGEGIYVTPTIFDADEKSATEIGSELATYQVRAREDELRHPSSPERPSLFSTRARTTSSRSRRWCCRPGRGAGVRSDPRCAGRPRRRGRPGPHNAAVPVRDHRIVYGHHAARSWRKSKRFWRRHAYDRH